MALLKQRCKFWKICKKYEKDSVTCNETGGEYYGPGRYGGCYRELNEQINNAKA